jgi:flagellar biosynthetic protein FlhB
MSGQEDDTEKPLDPTPRKLEKAREKGEVVKSADLSTAAAYGGLLLALLLAPHTLVWMGSAMMLLLDQPEALASAVLSSAPAAELRPVARAVVLALLPWFLLPALSALLAILAQRSLVVSADKLRPKLSRLSLVANARNKFGPQGIFEFAKSFAKLTVYSACMYVFLRARLDGMMASAQTDPMLAVAYLGRLCVEFLLIVLIVAVVIGGVDYAWQWHAHMRKHRMSHKEMKDEHKESEGDPQMKQARRTRAQEIASRRMMADVPTADVVMVNPTHYAVALTWSRKPGEAPHCVAKGVDEVAHRIREAAIEAGVPVHSDPPATRAIYATTDLGAEIAPDHYHAVAAAIRFAERMRRAARGRGRT